MDRGHASSKASPEERTPTHTWGRLCVLCVHKAPPASLRQPGGVEKLIGLVIKRKVCHGLPIRLEVGIGREVDPLELVGEAALHGRTDRLALLRLQRPPPL